MSPFKSHLLFFVFIFVLISCSTDNADSNTDADTLDPLESYQALNVSYGDDDDQRFDIYLPANRSLDTKIMILVHGGGWTSGDKSDMNAFRDFVRQEHPNLGIVNINYRLADENNDPYPMQINDITSVVEFLKDNQDNYIIGDDLGFLGVSAGAHLSLLYSYGFDTDNDVKMVGSIVGPTNFTDPAYLNSNNPDLQELINLYGIDPTIAFLEEVSPYHRVTASAPPTILFYGGMDPLIPTSQGTDMRDKLEELNVVHEFTLYPDAGHGWFGAELIDTSIKLKAFTQTYLE